MKKKAAVKKTNFLIRTSLDEQGQLLPILAVCSLLIVLLVISMMIDVPTSHSARDRAQKAFDAGALTGLSSHLGSYNNAMDLAYNHADAIFSGPGKGLFADPLSTNTSLDIAMPTFALDAHRARSGAPLTAEPPLCVFYGTRHAGCSGANLAGAFYPIGTGGHIINDYRNGIMLYARFTPYQRFEWASLLFGETDRESQIDVASAYRVGTMLTYILFDPAFTMNQENYISMFGRYDPANPNNDLDLQSSTVGGTNQYTWPVAAAQYANGWSNFGIPWDWPQDMASAKDRPELMDTPPDGAGSVCGTAAAPCDNLIDRYFHFYGAMCDSAPWVNFKEATVRLIDWLAQSSFSASTTAVGIAGFGHQSLSRYWPLIPLFPATTYTNKGYGVGEETDISIHPGLQDIYTVSFAGDPLPPGPLPLAAGATGFPLSRASGENSAVYMRRPKAFAGFINSANPHINASVAGPGADGKYQLRCDPADDDDFALANRRGTSLNRWELGFCAAYYREISGGSNSSGFRMVGGVQYNVFDNDNASPNDPVLDYTVYREDEEELVRSSSSDLNWADDDPTVNNNFEIDLGHRQSTAAGDGGETPRNLIAMQAIRVNNPGLDDIESPNNELASCLEVVGAGTPAMPDVPPAAPAAPQEAAWGTWQRPRIPIANTDPLGNPVTPEYNPRFDPLNDPMAAGWRYNAPAMMAAAQYLDAARRDYQADDLYGTKRPIASTTLVVNGFAPWNYSTVERLITEGATSFVSGTPIGDVDDAMDEFGGAVARILCEWKVNLVLNYLIMSEYDLQVIQALDNELIGPYEAYHSERDQGGNPPLPATASTTNPNACTTAIANTSETNLPIGRVYLLITDFTNSVEPGRFQGGAFPVEAWRRQKQLRASASYASLTPLAIKSILLQHALGQ